MMPKVEEISKAEKKKIPEAKKIFDDESTKVEPKTKFPLQKYNEIMEWLSKGNIPPQLDFFVGGHNFGFQNRIIQVEIDQDSRNLLAFLQAEMFQQLLLRNKRKTHVETRKSFYYNQNSNDLRFLTLSIYDFFSAQ